jgi:hypothetical protein
MTLKAKASLLQLLPSIQIQTKSLARFISKIIQTINKSKKNKIAINKFMQAKRRSLTNLFHHLNINWVTEQETYIQLQISSNLMIAILLDIIIFCTYYNMVFEKNK